MFYFPLKLRTRSGPTSVKGPDFKKAKSLVINIAGNIISLRAPKDNAGSTPAHPRKEAKPYYDLPLTSETKPEGVKLYPDMTPEEREQYDYELLTAPPRLRINGDGAPGWNIEVLAGRAWDFNGPWFSGALATVNMIVLVTREASTRRGSYFNPRIFEMAVMDHLAEGYGMHDMASIWRVPVDWKPLETASFPAVSYRVERKKGVRGFSQDLEDEYELVIPVTDEILVRINFEFRREHRRLPDNSGFEDIEKWTSSEPMRTLIQQIIDSVDVKLSPESQAQLERAQEGMQDRSLTKDFAPIDIEAYLKNKADVLKLNEAEKSEEKDVRLAQGCITQDFNKID